MIALFKSIFKSQIILGNSRYDLRFYSFLFPFLVALHKLTKATLGKPFLGQVNKLAKP